MPKCCLSLVAILFSVYLGCGQNLAGDEQTVRAINQNYVSAWLSNDADKIMSLFEENASITPGGAGFYNGKDKIKSFWFPQNGSVTTIDKFSNDIVFLKHSGDVMVATTNSKLSWTYQKGDTSFGKDQEGYALTFYRRQTDGSWKIWKQIWSDIWSKDR